MDGRKKYIWMEELITYHIKYEQQSVSLNRDQERKKKRYWGVDITLVKEFSTHYPCYISLRFGKGV